jgi:hypothetical protein
MCGVKNRREPCRYRTYPGLVPDASGCRKLFSCGGPYGTRTRGLVLDRDASTPLL